MENTELDKSCDQIKKKMNVTTYIDQFKVLGKDEYINCDYISQMLYAALLNKFMITMSEKEHAYFKECHKNRCMMTMTDEEYVYFKEYQERVFDLVENLRELSPATIPLIFNYLDQVNKYLPDIIIMLWCMPRPDTFLSKNMYNKAYRENIKKYNNKMIKNITHDVMKNFCIETLSKTNNVPVHCIDYLWFYMNTLSFDFTFYNYDNGGYIGFQMPEYNGYNIQHLKPESNEVESYIEFGFNMEYMLEMGLGQIVYVNDPGQKGSFRNFLKNCVTDITLVEKLLTLPSKHNYQKQMLTICSNPNKYFGKNQLEIPPEVIVLIKQKI